MTRGNRLAIASVLVAGILLSACSGGSTPSASSAGLSAADFASKICGQLGSFNDDVRGISSDTSAAYDPHGPLTDRKIVIIAFLKKVEARTQTLIDAVGAIGAPAVDGGDTALAKISAALAAAKSAEDHGLSKAEALPTAGDPKEFDREANAAGSLIQTSIAALATAISGLGVAALDQAFQEAPSCTSLSGGR